MNRHQPKLQIFSLDLLRTLAILMVILIHTSGRVMESVNFDVANNLWPFFLNQIARFAVPIFFLISGFLLETSHAFHQSYFVYIKKRVSKILIPYAVWSAIYYLFIYKKHIDTYWQTLLTGSASYQLYFIPTLLIFYSLFPILHSSVKLWGRKWTMLLLAGVQILVLANNYYVGPFNIFYPAAIASLNFFYFCFGVIAARNQNILLEWGKRLRYLLPIVISGMAGWIFWEGKSLFLSTHNHLMFYSQWRPSIFVYSISIFLWVFYVLNKYKFAMGIISKLAELSFFVFFVHIIILEWLWQLFPYWKEPFYFVTTTLISFTIALLIHKLRLAVKLFG